MTKLEERLEIEVIMGAAMLGRSSRQMEIMRASFVTGAGR